MYCKYLLNGDQTSKSINISEERLESNYKFLEWLRPLIPDSGDLYL